jgi:hypothetical protein
MDWTHILAYVTGTGDQELLARNEYLAAENRIPPARWSPTCGLPCRAERDQAQRDRRSPASRLAGAHRQAAHSCVKEMFPEMKDWA